MKPKKLRLFKLRSRVLCGVISLCIVCCLSGCVDLVPQVGRTASETVEPGTIGYQSEITLRYQYAMLTEKEKELYNLVLAALSNGDRSVDTAAYKFSSEVCKKILNAVLCDSPDLFWVSRNFMIRYESHFATAVYFRYFDGEVIDDYELQPDGEIVYSLQADHGRIRERIAQLERKTESCLSEVRRATPLESEIAVHDWVARTVSYNDAAAEAVKLEPTMDESWNFDQFTIYGALMDGSAVCEGYAKLFQYLCLLQQINCTQVSGYSDAQGHMWNAVSLADGWYFVDVTFDDLDSDEIACIYSYLNVDADMLQSTHVISDETLLTVPECDSDRLNYCNNYLIQITGGQISAAYEQKIQSALAGGEDYFLIYFPNADYTYPVLETALYYMDNSIEDCVRRYGGSIEKVMTIEPDYAIVFVEN